MEIVGYISSILIGISLGLIGGGGSILTVPVLVYLFSVDTVLATAYSLFVVGTTSAVGLATYFKKDLVNIKTAIVFGIPSILGVFLTRNYVITVIPEEIFSLGNFIITRSGLMMSLFAVLMIFASYSMIRKEQTNSEEMQNIGDFNYPLILGQGLFIGALTGLIGAGGGFLIIPALVNLLKIPMKKAIGTSLAIISINSLSGFLFSVMKFPINWQFLLTITSIAILGILIGSYFSSKIDGKKLKPVFGWFVLAMGLYIIIKETLLK